MGIVRALALTALAGVILSCRADGQPVKTEQQTSEAAPTAQEAIGNVVVPPTIPFDESLLPRLQVPPGFRISVFAKDLGNVRMLTAGANGVVYATRRQEGDVVALRDADGDGRAEAPQVLGSGMTDINGVTLHGGRLYVAPPERVLSAALLADGSVGSWQTFVDGLPGGNQHPNRTMAFGPDGRFYLTIGSSCNACVESDERRATMLRGDADGRNLRIMARGLRNTIGFDWHPGTGDLWGMDHGSDWRGDDQPPEELNRLVDGAHYGWPFCWGDRLVDTFTAEEPQGTTKAAFCPGTVGPALTITAHSAPLGMLFYRGSQFPADYRGDAFVALHGSWNRKPVSGYKLVRIRFANGKPQGVTDFVTGFIDPTGTAQIGRPCGLAQEPDGSLLLGDDTNGVIYRIRYPGGAARS